MSHDQWKAALPAEVEFWRQVISGERPETQWVEAMRRRAAGTHPFPESLRPYMARTGTTRILDVGAGPVTYIGAMGAPSPVEIVAVDPLAEVYNKLLNQYGLTPAVPTCWAEGEHLSERGLGTFDIVYGRNAIDHTYDPLRVIREMVAVCKPSGVVFIEGHVNEDAKGYAGLRQWNFMPLNNGDLVIWQQDNKAVSLRSIFGAAANIRAQGSEWYTVEIRPRAQSNNIRRWPPWLRLLVRRVKRLRPSAR